MLISKTTLNRSIYSRPGVTACVNRSSCQVINLVAIIPAELALLQSVLKAINPIASWDILRQQFPSIRQWAFDTPVQKYFLRLIKMPSVTTLLRL
jgi:hypothetical protein